MSIFSTYTYYRSPKIISLFHYSTVPKSKKVTPDVEDAVLGEQNREGRREGEENILSSTFHRRERREDTTVFISSEAVTKIAAAARMKKGKERRGKYKAGDISAGWAASPSPPL